MSSLLRPRPLAALSLVLFAVGCGSNDPTGPQPPVFALTGTFSDSAGVQSPARISIPAGRTGPMTVAVCAAEGAVIDLVVGTQNDTTDTNCERVTFNAIAGRTYEAQVFSVSGSGRFNGCYSISLYQCEVIPPTPGGPGGPPAANCTPRPFSPGDTAVPAGYYAGAEGKTGVALIQALYAITCTQRVLGYTFARDSMYANVDDPDNDDIIIDIYVGRSATVNSRATAAAVDFNTEHTWPQSRGANEEPAQSDINILFSADEISNSVRLNYPFGNVTGSVDWTSPPQPGVNEQSRRGMNAGRIVFEPRDSKKGDIARAILYFYVRYKLGPTPSFSLQNFNVEEATLIQWSQQDPPDEFERARNNRVFRAQGNRNPFIDRPEFVAAIGDFPNT